MSVSLGINPVTWTNAHCKDVRAAILVDLDLAAAQKLARVRGQNTEIAQAVRQKDPEWHARILWRSELRNVLTAYLRRALLTRAQIVGILSIADQALAEREHIIPDNLVLMRGYRSVPPVHSARSQPAPVYLITAALTIAWRPWAA